MRTDRTQLCAACALRFSPPDDGGCPRCGTRKTYDLTVDRARADALKWTRRRQSEHAIERLWPRAWDWYYKYCVAGAAALGFVFGLSGGPVYALALAAMCTVLAGALPIAMVPIGMSIAGLYTTGRALYRRAKGIEDPPVPTRAPRIELQAQSRALPGPAVRGRVVVRGVVRCDRPVQSPVQRRPCAAFRVYGTGPTGTIDDAGVTSFEVVGDPDGPAQVVGDTATVALAVPSALRPVVPAGDLLAFLRVRGAYPELGSVRLAEVVLSDGDRVEIEGVAELQPTPAGYRGTAYKRVFRDHPNAPVIVRAGSEAAAGAPVATTGGASSPP